MSGTVSVSTMVECLSLLREILSLKMIYSASMCKERNRRRWDYESTFLGLDHRICGHTTDTAETMALVLVGYVVRTGLASYVASHLSVLSYCLHGQPSKSSHLCYPQTKRPMRAEHSLERCTLQSPERGGGGLVLLSTLSSNCSYLA